MVLCLLFAGCGDDGGGPAAPRDAGPGIPVDGGGGRDAGSARDAAGMPPGDAGDVPPTDAGPRMVITVPGGDVMGDWCGDVTVTANVTVPAGATLTVCAGSVVTFDASVGMAVAGTLRLAGTAAAPIALTSSGRWQGLAVTGELAGDFTDISRAGLAVEGRAGSTIRLDDSTIAMSPQTISLLNGGTFDRTTVTGGNTILISGGVLHMTGSTIDFGHPTVSPDCTAFSGSGAVLDHVLFTGCHCPLHINSAPGGFMVTNSIFSDATNPVMIAGTVATFHGNHFLGVGTKMLDIGGGITADVSGNYWGGGPADIGTSAPGQFTGADVFETMPIAGAGP